MALNPVVIERGIRVEFARQMAAFLAARNLNPGLMALVMMITSTGAYEKMNWLGAVPGVQEWIGELNASEMAGNSYTIRNRDWAASVPINQNDIDDDQTGVIQMIPQYLVQRIMAHPVELIIDLITNGTTNPAYDGVAYFSDVTGARTIDNLAAGTGTTLAQIEADLNTNLATMASFKDDKGKVLNIQGNLIVCPMAIVNKMKRLVGSDTDPTAAVAGTLNPYAGRFTVIGDARLDAVDANDWYLFATGEIIKPFVFSMRQEAQPQMEKITATKSWLASANYRGNAGYGLPHLGIKIVN
jgi:phage major head subunit gpT-like protein